MATWVAVLKWAGKGWWAGGGWQNGAMNGPGLPWAATGEIGEIAETVP